MKHLFVAAATASLALATQGTASVVIDQQQNAGPRSSNGSTGIGQSFTAGLNAINFATFFLALDTANPTVAVQLYSGAGYAGTVLGTTNSYTLMSTTETPLQFDFSSLISLNVGSVYTLRIASTGGTYAAAFSTSDPYSGGGLYLSGGALSTSNDLRFAEGISTPAAVPEPTTWAMFIGGFGLVGSAMRRRKVSVRFA